MDKKLKRYYCDYCGKEVTADYKEYYGNCSITSCGEAACDKEARYDVQVAHGEAAEEAMRDVDDAFGYRRF